jgi:hypothetical protein
MAPTLIIPALIAGWPLARTICFNRTDVNLNSLNNYEFIGFENDLANYDGEWLGLLTDPDWWRSVWNTVWFTIVSVSIETVLGIVAALILNAAFPGRGIMRAVILIPWAIPTVGSARMWNWMLHDQFFRQSSEALPSLSRATSPTPSSPNLTSSAARQSPTSCPGLSRVFMPSFPPLYPHPEEQPQAASRRIVQQSLEPPSKQSLRDFLRIRVANWRRRREHLSLKLDAGGLPLYCL